MCQDCYRQGRTCRSPDTHRLYVYLRANSDGPHPDIATDGIGCKACKAKIKQGPFYFCGKCGDDFGICDRCYEMDKTCSDSDHVLTRYVVYKGEKQISNEITPQIRAHNSITATARDPDRIFEAVIFQNNRHGDKGQILRRV